MILTRRTCGGKEKPENPGAKPKILRLPGMCDIINWLGQHHMICGFGRKQSHVWNCAMLPGQTAAFILNIFF